VLACSDDEVIVDVDTDDRARVADEVGEQRGVVAGPGADLEHTVARLDVQLLEHDGHDRRLGGGADGSTIGAPLGRVRLVSIGPCGRDIGQEHVPRDDPKRVGQPFALQVASGLQIADQLLAQLAKAAVWCGVWPGHESVSSHIPRKVAKRRRTPVAAARRAECPG
jgi:hypothetical protein